MNAKVLTCTHEQYTADPCAKPSLNQSVAKILMEKSPLHAYMAHPRLGGLRREATKAMDIGTLAHKFLLGEGHEIIIVNADDWRTNAAKQQRDEAREKGFTAILQKQFDESYFATERIKENLALLDIDLQEEGSQNEFKIQFKSDGVLCRRALDSWHEDKLQIRELKSTACAHPTACARQAINLGYDIEYAASIDAIQTLHPEYAGRIDFLFIFVELEAPFAVYACRPDGVFSQLGFHKWDQAKKIWKQCLEENVWPAYSEIIGSLSAPLWAMKQLIEEGYDGFTAESF